MPSLGRAASVSVLKREKGKQREDSVSAKKDKDNTCQLDIPIPTSPERGWTTSPSVKGAGEKEYELLLFVSGGLGYRVCLCWDRRLILSGWVISVLDFALIVGQVSGRFAWVFLWCSCLESTESGDVAVNIAPMVDGPRYRCCTSRRTSPTPSTAIDLKLDDIALGHHDFDCATTDSLSSSLDYVPVNVDHLVIIGRTSMLVLSFVGHHQAFADLSISPRGCYVHPSRYALPLNFGSLSMEPTTHHRRAIDPDIDLNVKSSSPLLVNIDGSTGIWSSSWTDCQSVMNTFHCTRALARSRWRRLDSVEVCLMHKCRLSETLLSVEGSQHDLLASRI
ncbi:hypothetical protein BDZ89DRAFT_1148155 [Hymenopellis radicata]|nr:hypothetical protein BDZ89DRAFT_1148155 [Hymenopellis radicata]